MDVKQSVLVTQALIEPDVPTGKGGQAGLDPSVAVVYTYTVMVSG